MFRNSASFFTPLRAETVRSAANCGGVQKVVHATKLSQVCPPFPAIHCSAGSGFAGAPFRNMLTRVAEAFSDANSRKLKIYKRSIQCGATLCCLHICNSRVRKGRPGRAESLSHLPRWSLQKRDTPVAQPLRLNMLPRNFCATSRFCKRKRTVNTFLRVWQERSPARSSLPPPQCLHKSLPMMLHAQSSRCAN